LGPRRRRAAFFQSEGFLMSAPATIPFSPPASVTPPKANSRPWSPSDRDRLIFQWVKFEGHTQSWVADQLDMSQSTVSRILERYEKWIARGGPARGGGLSHDERLRAQRWMTYERNEWILTSALRIAGEMERSLDTSKSTITRAASSPSQESEIRTEHKVIDRSGIAARFLRLAHRINMDQLKLAEQQPLPELEPLDCEEINELSSGDQNITGQDNQPATAHCHPEEDAPDPEELQPHLDETMPVEPLRAPVPSRDNSPAPLRDNTPAPLRDNPPAHAPPPMLAVHNSAPAEPDALAGAATTCAPIAATQKTSPAAYPVATEPPEMATAIHAEHLVNQWKGISQTLAATCDPGP
jgi:sigma-70-like protein